MCLKCDHTGVSYDALIILLLIQNLAHETEVLEKIKAVWSMSTCPKPRPRTAVNEQDSIFRRFHGLKIRNILVELSSSQQIYCLRLEYILDTY